MPINQSTEVGLICLPCINQKHADGTCSNVVNCEAAGTTRRGASLGWSAQTYSSGDQTWDLISYPKKDIFNFNINSYSSALKGIQSWEIGSLRWGRLVTMSSQCFSRDHNWSNLRGRNLLGRLLVWNNFFLFYLILLSFLYFQILYRQSFKALFHIALWNQSFHALRGCLRPSHSKPSCSSVLLAADKLVFSRIYHPFISVFDLNLIPELTEDILEYCIRHDSHHLSWQAFDI